MSNFFEKLKKGMGVEIPEEEKTTEKSAAESETTAEKVKPAQKRKKIKKVEIKTEPIEEKESKIKELETESVTEKKPALLKAPIDKEKRVKSERQDFDWQNLAGQEGQLAVDVYQTNGELIIQSAIAGVKPEDLDISIEADIVLIKGNRQKPSENGERNYFYQECYWGPFSRQIILPEETDPTRAEATMKEGVLSIRIPKIERKKKRKIEVKAR